MCPMCEKHSTASLRAAEVCGSCGGLQTGQGYHFALLARKYRDEGYQWSLNYPYWGDQTIQIYGRFEGFSENHSA